jgi:phytoene dehydrogenase-like protein
VPREQWDAVVIGSGLGGLACAAYLAAAGRRTLVLETHYVAGGNSQVFRRRHQGRAYEFDVGIHYIGECGPEGTITRILRGVGLAERVAFRPLDADGFSTLVFPDLTFRVPAGWDRYRARLLATFPDEAAELGRVVDCLCDVGEEGRRFANGEIAAADLFAQAPRFAEWGLRPVTALFDAHRLSERARAVLLGEQGDYAVPPSRTSVALHAGITDHYMRGAFYPEGGGQVIAARLVEAIRADGGQVRTHAPVARVRMEGGRVAGVVLAGSGEEIDAPVVVSNADLKRTVGELVGEAHFAPETVERVRGYRMSLPLFIVYLGVRLDLVRLGLPNTSWFLWGTYDIEGVYRSLEAGRIPDEDVVYVTAASLKDPENPRLAPAGYANVQVMTVVPREYALWHVGPEGPAGGAYHRDPEYRRRKAELAARLVRGAARVIPGLADAIDWEETATPVTQERFTGATGGTSYGIEFACDQMGPLRIGPETDVRGLYLCGASTPFGHGIGQVLRSGVAAASAVLGRDLMRAVAGGEVLADRERLPPLRAGWDPWRVAH